MSSQTVPEFAGLQAPASIYVHLRTDVLVIDPLYLEHGVGGDGRDHVVVVHSAEAFLLQGRPVIDPGVIGKRRTCIEHPGAQRVVRSGNGRGILNQYDEPPSIMYVWGDRLASL